MSNKELANYLDDIIKTTTSALSSRESINKIPRELYIAAFYSSIIQYADTISSLIKKNKLIAVPTIFRSFLEAYVELINLCKYKDNYIDVLNSIYLWQRIKKFEAVLKEPNNPFLKDTIENFDDVRIEIKELKKQKNEVDKRISNFTGDIKQIKRRFEFADLRDAYTGIYSQLCEDSHNGLLRVESRHIKKYEEEIFFSIQTSWNLEDVAPHVITTVDILKSALINISHHLEISESENYIKQIEKKEKLIESHF